MKFVDATFRDGQIGSIEDGLWWLFGKLPPSTAPVKTAAAKKNQKNNNDQQGIGIHKGLLREPSREQRRPKSCWLWLTRRVRIMFLIQFQSAWRFFMLSPLGVPGAACDFRTWPILLQKSAGAALSAGADF